MLTWNSEEATKCILIPEALVVKRKEGQRMTGKPSCARARIKLLKTESRFIPLDSGANGCFLIMQ